MNTPVSFEISRLLKEKGIKIDTDEVIFYRDEVNNIEEHQIKNRDVLYNYTGFDNYIPDENEYQTYMIAEIVMWLYEKHEYWCYAYTNGKIWHPCIQHKFGDMAVLSGKIGGFNSPTKAYEAAIYYTLNNLI